MNVVHRDAQTILKLSLGLRCSALVLLMGLGYAKGIENPAIAQPRWVSQQPDPQKTGPSAAQAMLDEAIKLYREGSAQSLRQSIAKFQSATSGFAAVGDRAAQATCLNNIGHVYSELGEQQNALDYFAQALPLRWAVGDRTGEATTLDNMGGVYDDLGEKQKALDYYAQALPIRRAVGDRAGEAGSLNNIGLVYVDLGENQKALEYFAQALSLWRTMGNRNGEARTLINMGEVYARLGENPKALDHYSQALPLFRAVGDRRGEAATLNHLGGIYTGLGKNQKALDHYNQALPLFRAVGNRGGEAGSLTSIGFVYASLGENQKALDYYAQALPLRRAVGDRAGEATTLNSTGLVYDALGESQKALDYYAQALPLFLVVGNRRGEGDTLHNIGSIYAGLGENPKALDYYAQALSLFESMSDRTGAATTLNNIGSVYDVLGEKQKALDYFTQALSLRRAVGDRDGEAGSLNNIGLVYDALGDKPKALNYYAQALPILRAVGDRRGEGITLSNIGGVYAGLGESQKALDYYSQALPFSRVVGDRREEANTLAHTAKAYLIQGSPEKALKEINLAITIIEDLRTKIGSQDLRAAYFATKQNYYQFKTDLLMQLHQQSPKKGYDKQALETADRGRARGLIELLAEAGITLQPTTESSPVVTQERQLQQSLRQLEQQRVVLLSGEHTPTQAEALDKQSDTLVAQLQDLTTRLRATNPAYANLKHPQPLTTSQIQQQVVDPETVLLQYALGETQSYLWAVTPNGIKTYPLPGRAVLEAAVKPFQSVISNSGNTVNDAKRTGDVLYEIILAPAADQLQDKRLLVVADGALQFIPFGALPLPNQSDYVPLIKNHEIINAPSASSIAILRQQQFPVAAKTLAVFADPVFRADDGRITGKDNPNLGLCAPALKPMIRNSTQAQQLPIDLQRDLHDLDLRGIQRLPNTRIEAERILALVSPNQRSAACAFSANYDQVTQPKRDSLDQYRIVHFATHGFINSERPQFSGLVLSLVDLQGKPRDGFLRLRDIFNLKLSADLVVLSACQTGLGKDIRGEGIVGLTRGFMYAGSKRVITSLWNVDDAATAQLMGTFYRGMLKEKQTPAVALRNAQLQMWRTNPDPRLWAAFTLQGEWRP
jgi:CHAT domain-containing protein/tetratricopeptide (TPR) repeat protein